jgi:hypothetical protein
MCRNTVRRYGDGCPTCGLAFYGRCGDEALSDIRDDDPVFASFLEGHRVRPNNDGGEE